jgi:phosphate-selective porin OprO and OprP
VVLSVSLFLAARPPQPIRPPHDAEAYPNTTAHAHRPTGRGRPAETTKVKPTNQTPIIIASLLATVPAFAGPPADKPAPVEKPAVSELDRLWSLATLYKNPANPFLQEFKLRGRYQGQYHWLDSDQGDDDGWENRRSRFGFDAKLLHDFDLRVDFQSNDEFDPFYDRLVDAYLKWHPSENFSLTLGKQKPQIGYYDWLQSTNAQPTFERSQIFNQLRVDRVTGAVAEGKHGKWSWQAGVYSNDVDREFGGFDGGWSAGLGIGYDFKEAWALDKADFRFDWLHSSHDSVDTVLNRYDDILSATLWLKEGRWSLVTEAFYATGTAPDAFGFYIQPTYDLIPKKLQAVARYSFATGDGPDSLTAQSRYERTAPSLTGGGRGETYHAAYLGVQYFIHGDKLKLLAGAEYAHLDGGGNGGDFDGITALTGIRFSF